MTSDVILHKVGILRSSWSTDLGHRGMSVVMPLRVNDATTERASLDDAKNTSCFAFTRRPIARLFTFLDHFFGLLFWDNFFGIILFSTMIALHVWLPDEAQQNRDIIRAIARIASERSSTCDTVQDILYICSDIYNPMFTFTSPLAHECQAMYKMFIEERRRERAIISTSMRVYRNLNVLC